jgi:hypothetical protein
LKITYTKGWIAREAAGPSPAQLRKMKEQEMLRAAPTRPVPMQQVGNVGAPQAVAPQAVMPAVAPPNPKATPRPASPVNMNGTPPPAGNPAQMAAPNQTPQSQQTPYSNQLEQAKRNLALITQKPQTPQDVASAKQMAQILQQMGAKLEADANQQGQVPAPFNGKATGVV